MGGDIGGGIAILGVVVLIILVYLAVKAINLVCRVLAAHPSNKLVWVLLAAVFLFGVIAIATRGEPIALILTLVSMIALLLTCRILDLYYANSLQKQGTLVENVLRRKWWEPVSPNVALAA